MKTASLPSIRVEPELRDALEGVLAKGETVSAFVESSVRAALRKRQAQTEFVARGMASLAAIRAGETTHSVEDVMGELRAKLAVARASKGKTSKAA